MGWVSSAVACAHAPASDQHPCESLPLRQVWQLVVVGFEMLPARLRSTALLSRRTTQSSDGGVQLRSIIPEEARRAW